MEASYNQYSPSSSESSIMGAQDRTLEVDDTGIRRRGGGGWRFAAISSPPREEVESLIRNYQDGIATQGQPAEHKRALFGYSTYIETSIP